MTSLRRFLVVQAFAVWQGGFVFYSAVVVPVGTDVLGSASLQAEVTRPVAGWLNRLGVAWAAVFLWDLLADRDPDPGRRRLRWAGWTLAVELLLALAVLHTKLARLLDADVPDPAAFRRWHAVYLWASTAEWLVGLLLAWLTLRAWSSVGCVEALRNAPPATR